jgi:hypothetical protein
MHGRFTDFYVVSRKDINLLSRVLDGFAVSIVVDSVVLVQDALQPMLDYFGMNFYQYLAIHVSAAFIMGPSFRRAWQPQL